MWLSDYFRSQAESRGGKAEEYPEDKRNAQSARALESLAEYVECDEAGSVVDALAPYLDTWKDQFGDAYELVLGGEETARAVARYGFGYNATSPTQHAEFLGELRALWVEDAYDFAREHDDDPTEMLLPHEMAAARDGVFLPQRYFKRRANSTEQALEEWVAAEREETNDE